MSEEHVTKAAEGIRQARENPPAAPAVDAPLPVYRMAEPDMDVVERICAYIGSGNYLNAAFRKREDPTHEMYGIPRVGMFLHWVITDERVHERYARAKLACGENYGMRVLEVCEEILENPDVKRVNAARVAIQGFQWAAGKLNAGAFGDNKTLTLDATSNFVKALERVESASRRIDKARAIDVKPDAATMRQELVVSEASD